MALPAIDPVRLAGRVLRGAWRGLAIGALTAAFASMAFAQNAASAPAPQGGSGPGAGTRGLAPAAAVSEVQAIPAERSVPGTIRIEPVEEDYRIGTQDLIEVQVLGVQELRREVRVNAKGLIGLPLIGAVRVAGLTTAEAETLVAGLYGKNYLQSPEVSVFVKEYTRQNVTIDGAVAKPGIYPLKGPTTLLQALALAGGQGALSDPTDVVLFRMEEGERRALRFDIVKIRGAEAPDPLLQPGDLVVVNRSPARVAIRDSLFGDILQVIFNPFTSIVKP